MSEEKDIIEEIESWKYPTREQMRQAIYSLITEVKKLRNQLNPKCNCDKCTGHIWSIEDYYDKE